MMMVVYINILFDSSKKMRVMWLELDLANIFLIKTTKDSLYDPKTNHNKQRG